MLEGTGKDEGGLVSAAPPGSLSGRHLGGCAKNAFCREKSGGISFRFEDRPNAKKRIRHAIRNRLSGGGGKPKGIHGTNPSGAGFPYTDRASTDFRQ